MKIRSGFVSNSSSSSFTCEVCNSSESGWDASPGELGFETCSNEHTICDSCLLDETKILKEPLQDDYQEAEIGEEEYEKDYDIWAKQTQEGYITLAEEGCPICQFIEPSQRQIARYLEKRYNIPKDLVFEEVKKSNKRRKRLYDFEYITYICQKEGIELTALLGQLKEKYGTYKQFLDDIYGRGKEE